MITRKVNKEEIRNIPDGVYEFEDWVDNDGSIENLEPLKIFVKMTVDKSNIKFDFEDLLLRSKPQLTMFLPQQPQQSC